MIYQYDALYSEKLTIEAERDKWLKRKFIRPSLLANVIISVFLAIILTIILWIASIFIDPLNSIGWAFFDFAGNFTDSKFNKYLLSIFVIPIVCLSTVCFIFLAASSTKGKEDEREANFNKEKNDALAKLNTSLDSITTRIDDLVEELFENTIVEEELVDAEILPYLIEGIELAYANTYEEAVIYYKRQLRAEQKEEERRRHIEQLHQERLEQERELADRAYEQREEHNRDVIKNIREYGYYE